MVTYQLYAKHTYTASISVNIDDKMQKVIEELKLLKDSYPSIKYDVYSSGIEIFGNNQIIVEAAADNFLYAIKRHDWWEHKA